MSTNVVKSVNIVMYILLSLCATEARSRVKVYVKGNVGPEAAVEEDGATDVGGRW